jgi:hypothetical protein
MKTLKRIDVSSAAIMYGVIGAATGFILGIFFLLFGGLMSSLGGGLSGRGNLGAGLGIISIIVFPILYGIIGLIGGALAAVFYNLFAGMVGGIKIEIE